MSSLYIISEDLLKFQEELELNEGEVTDEFYKKLVITENEFKAKIESYCKFIKSLENDENFASDELIRIAKFKQTKTNLKNKLKDAVLTALKTFGTKDVKKDLWRLEAGTFKLGTRQSTILKITNAELIEERFKNLTISKLSLEDKVKILDSLGKNEGELNIVETIDNAAIKAELTKDVIVIGAELEKNYSLQVK